MSLPRLTPRQGQQALKGALAAFLAMGVLQLVPATERISDEAFYLLYGVARSVLATQKASAVAFRERILGTLFGGVVVGLLRIVMGGWLAVGVAYVIVQLSANRLRLGPGMRINAITMAFLLMLIPGYGEQGFHYVFARLLWHLVGLTIGLLVERLFWPEDPALELHRLEGVLLERVRPLAADRLPPTGHREVEELIGLFRRYREVLVSGEVPLVAPTHGSGEAAAPESRPQLIEQALVHGIARARLALLPWQEPLWQRRLEERDRRELRRALAALGVPLPASPPLPDAAPDEPAAGGG